MDSRHRPYVDETDFHALLADLSEMNVAHPAAGFIQPGDLTWWMRQNQLFDPYQAIELFQDGNGHALGFVFSDPSTWAVIQARPGVAEAVIDDMLRYARQRAGGEQLTVWTFEGDTSLAAALHRAGFARRDPRTIQFEYRPQQGLPVVPTLPNGFSFRAVLNDYTLKTERVDLHRAVWDPSKVTLAAYEALRSALTYDLDLDVVVVRPEGRLAAYALGWFDPHSRMGVLEPVGTHPEQRGRGLGKAVVQEVTRRLADRGAERIIVRTPERNQAAVRLYAAAGFGVSGFVNEYQG